MASSAAAVSVTRETSSVYILPPQDQAPLQRQNFGEVYPAVKNMNDAVQREHDSVDRLFTKSATCVLSQIYERGAQPDYLKSLATHRHTYLRLAGQIETNSALVRAMTQAKSPLAPAAARAFESAQSGIMSLSKRISAFAPNMDTVNKLSGLFQRLQVCEGRLTPEVAGQMQGDLEQMLAAKDLLMYMPANVVGAIQGLQTVVSLASTSDSYSSDFYPALHEVQDLFPRANEADEIGLKGLEDTIGQLKQLEAFAASSREQNVALQSKLAASAEKLVALTSTLEQTGSAIREAFEEYQGLQSSAVQLLTSQIDSLERASGLKDQVLQQLGREASQTATLREKVQGLEAELTEVEESSKKQIVALTAEKDAMTAKAEQFRSVVFNIDSWVNTIRAHIAPVAQPVSQQ